MKVILLSLSLLLSCEVYAQDSFKLPDKLSGTPVDYLENLKVRDSSRQMSEKEKHELCRLFIKAYAVSVRKRVPKQLLSPDAPIYQLLAANFPRIKAREIAPEDEHGLKISLGAIAGFFNSLPEYRTDVVEVLRQGIDGKNCGR